MPLLPQFNALHEQAVIATGLDDFGPSDYVEPLKLLLSTYDHAGKLNALGEQMTIGPVVAALIGRLFAHHGFKQHPRFVDAKIEKPIIILGMPRTGSTALHRLLSKDPDSQWLTPWICNTPMPRPPREAWEDNSLYKMTAQALEQFYQIFPSLAAMHPIRPDEADECRFIFDHTFWSPAMVGLGAAGDYAEWIFDHDVRPTYAYHRKVLGLIAGGDTRRWILKDPTTHPFAVKALLQTYPDACIVCTHRDPVTVMASVSCMVYSLRRLSQPGLTAEQNARDQLRLWGTAAAKMENVLGTLPPERIFNVHVKELNSNPVGVAKSLYRHFDLPVTKAASAAWMRHAERDARCGHGEHRYSSEDCGFGARDVYAAIGSYGERYRQLYECGA